MTAMSPSVLVVDDDDTFRGVLSRELAAAGLTVDSLSRGEEVEGALLENAYDVVIVDLRMTGMDGLATLTRIKEVRPLTEVIILTGHGSVETAVQALKLGAFDFLTKPCDLDHLESLIRRAAGARAMRSENVALRQALSRRSEGIDIIGGSPRIVDVRELIERVAPTNSTVLIRGESGTGKEVAARAIHALSTRCDRPIVVLDCGATEESLVLSELFGHEKGAFTGADVLKHGLFELADSGTILIDEVGDAPLSLQTRLLRVLETGTLRRLGSEESIRVDCRVLASTHRDLEARVKEGTFRQDLYYRLNVFSVNIPPLRERLEDVPAFVDYFLSRLCPGVATSVEPKAMKQLQSYAWPGNVRELRNVLERAVILSGGGAVRACHLPSTVGAGSDGWDADLDAGTPTLREVEGRYVAALMERYKGDRGKVAALLGVSERTLYRKIRSLDIDLPRGS